MWFLLGGKGKQNKKMVQTVCSFPVTTPLKDLISLDQPIYTRTQVCLPRRVYRFGDCNIFLFDGRGFKAIAVVKSPPPPTHTHMNTIYTNTSNIIDQ